MRAARLLIVLSLTATLRADPTPEEEAFLRVPGAISPTQVHQTFRAGDLPAGMIAILQQYEWGVSGDGILTEFHGFTLDLNHDAKPEYFIATIYGGSDGPDYMILTQGRHSWWVISGFQGSLHVFPSKRGWPRLVTISRGGGGNWAKTYHTFEMGNTKKPC
jgi:hypothetical protein